MKARGLDVLTLTTADGLVVTSGHLPGRAGDADPELAPVLQGPPGVATPRVVTRAGASGPEPVLALVAWAPLPGEGQLRLAGGLDLGQDRALRLAALTGGEVTIRTAAGAVLAQASAPSQAGAPLLTRIGARLGVGLSGTRRTLPLGPPDAPLARVEISVASQGLARAAGTVLVAFLGALVAGALGAVAAGRLIASRITRPVEALREAAARVAGGDLSARVVTRESGEVGELVRAFNTMTQDLASGRVRLAQAERVAAWREVARRLAHEIKNPLTPIAMSVETLRDAQATGRADFREIFDEGTRTIGEEVRRLKRIVDEFSRFARLPAPERTPVAAEDLVSSVLALFPAPPGLEVQRRIDPDLPPVFADRDQALQVLLNLVRNAIDAMPQGGVLRVSGLRPRRRGGAVGGRHRPRHPGRGSAPAVRALLHAQGGRHRAGAGHRPADRRGARQPPGGGVDARRRRGVHVLAAGRVLRLRAPRRAGGATLGMSGPVSPINARAWP